MDHINNKVLRTLRKPRQWPRWTLERKKSCPDLMETSTFHLYISGKHVEREDDTETIELLAATYTMTRPVPIALRLAATADRIRRLPPGQRTRIKWANTPKGDVDQETPKADREGFVSLEAPEVATPTQMYPYDASGAFLTAIEDPCGPGEEYFPPNSSNRDLPNDGYFSRRASQEVQTALIAPDHGERFFTAREAPFKGKEGAFENEVTPKKKRLSRISLGGIGSFEAPGWFAAKEGTARTVESYFVNPETLSNKEKSSSRKSLGPVGSFGAPGLFTSGDAPTPGGYFTARETPSDSVEGYFGQQKTPTELHPTKFWPGATSDHDSYFTLKEPPANISELHSTTPKAPVDSSERYFGRQESPIKQPDSLSFSPLGRPTEISVGAVRGPEGFSTAIEAPANPSEGSFCLQDVTRQPRPTGLFLDLAGGVEASNFTEEKPPYPIGTYYGAPQPPRDAVDSYFPLGADAFDAEGYFIDVDSFQDAFPEESPEEKTPENKPPEKKARKEKSSEEQSPAETPEGSPKDYPVTVLTYDDAEQDAEKESFEHSVYAIQRDLEDPETLQSTGPKRWQSAPSNLSVDDYAAVYFVSEAASQKKKQVGEEVENAAADYFNPQESLRNDTPDDIGFDDAAKDYFARQEAHPEEKPVAVPLHDANVDYSATQDKSTQHTPAATKIVDSVDDDSAQQQSPKEKKTDSITIYDARDADLAPREISEEKQLVAVSHYDSEDNKLIVIFDSAPHETPSHDSQVVVSPVDSDEGADATQDFHDQENEVIVLFDAS